MKVSYDARISARFSGDTFGGFFMRSKKRRASITEQGYEKTGCLVVGIPFV